MNLRKKKKKPVMFSDQLSAELQALRQQQKLLNMQQTYGGSTLPTWKPPLLPQQAYPPPINGPVVPGPVVPLLPGPIPLSIDFTVEGWTMESRHDVLMLIYRCDKCGHTEQFDPLSVFAGFITPYETLKPHMELCGQQTEKQEAADHLERLKRVKELLEDDD